jgi:Ras-related protein Rab-5C
MENYKLVLLGDSSVGKSSLAVNFISKQFYEFQEPTIGAAFLNKTITIENKTINIEIWDTAGQERYKSLAPMYYRGAEGAIIVYDITNKDSFNGAKKWFNEIKSNGSENCQIILVGNKIDLEKHRNIEKEEVINFIIEKNISHMLTSAKTGDNIELVFEKISRKILKNRKTMENNENRNPNIPIEINLNENKVASCCY